MAAPMVSENVRFKINVMMYNILIKLNKKYTFYNILSLMVCVNLRCLTHFQHYGCMFL